MSHTKMDPSFPLGKHVVSDVQIAEIVAQSLRHEFGDQPSSVKRIARFIGVHPRAVKNWLSLRNTPSVAHFLKLAKLCVPIRDFIHKELFEEQYNQDLLAHNTLHILEENDDETPIYTDKNVGINFPPIIKTHRKMNQRQIWFLQEIHSGNKVNGRDIAHFWGVTPRSAERDVKTLIDLGIIIFKGSRKNGHYSITEK